MGVYDYDVPDFLKIDDADIEAMVQSVTSKPAAPYVPPIAAPPDESEFVKGVKRGTEGLKSAAYGAAGLVGSGLGIDSVRDWGYQGFLEHEEEAAKHAGRVQNIEDIQSIGDAGDWAAGTFGSLLPSIGEAAVTSVAGAAIGSAMAPGAGTVGGAVTGLVGKQAAKSMIRKLAREYVKGGMERQVAKSAAKEAIESLPAKALMRNIGTKAGIVAGTAPIEAGGMWGEGMQEGKDNPYSAAVFGTLSGLSELLGGEAELIDIFTNPARQAVKGNIIRRVGTELAKTIPQEALQEATQETLAIINRKVVDPAYDMFGPEARSRVMNSAAAGALGGVAFGVGGGVFSGRNEGRGTRNGEGEDLDPQTSNLEPGSIEPDPWNAAEEPPHPVTAAEAEEQPVLPEEPKGALSRAVESAQGATIPSSGETPVAPISRTTDELVIDEALDWADQQIADGKTHLMRQVAEHPDTHRKRVLQEYRRQQQPVPEMQPPQGGPKYVKMEMVNPETGAVELVSPEEVRARFLEGWRPPVPRPQSPTPEVDDDILSTVSDADRGLLRAAAERLSQWEHSGTDGGFSNREQMYPWLAQWPTTSPGEVAKAIGRFLDGKKLGEVQQRLVPEALKWERENRQKSGVAPISSIGDLVAERRGRKGGNVERGTRSEEKENLESPTLNLEPSVRKRAELYAEKEGVDLDGWPDEDIAGFVRQYEAWRFAERQNEHITQKLRTTKDPKARARLQKTLEQVRARQEQLISKGVARGEKTDLQGVDGEAPTGADTVPTVQKLDGQASDGMPVVQLADGVASTPVPSPQPPAPNKGGVQSGLSEVQEEVVGEKEEVPAVRGEAVDQQAHEAATSPNNDRPVPTQAQAEAGNYKKGHVSLHGFDISIENPKGSTRNGVDENGKAWETKLAHHYGYIKGTVGKDKDHVDVFIGPKTDSTRVFVVDQVDPKTGKLDEHKVLLGFPNPLGARLGYLANYDKSGKDRIGAMTETTPEGLKEWFKGGDQKKPFGEVARGAQQGKTKEETEVRQPVKDIRKQRVEEFKKKYGYAEDAEKTASQNAPETVFEGKAIPEPGPEYPAKTPATQEERQGEAAPPASEEKKAVNRERFKEAQRRHIKKKLAEAQTEKEKTRYEKLLEKLQTKKQEAPTQAASIDEEFQNISLEDFSNLVDEVAAEVRAEQSPPVDEKARRAAKFKKVRREHITRKLAEAKEPKERERLRKALEKLNAGKTAAVGEMAGEKPEKDNAKESFFKKGQRVQLEDGSHGEVSEVTSYTMRSALLDITRHGGVGFTERTEETNHMYNVRKDNGVVVHASFRDIFSETDPAPAVIPAPVFDGSAVDPGYLVRSIQSDRDTARSKRASASRAKKRENIDVHNRAADIYEKQATEKQAVFDAWATRHPDEAAKYQPKTDTAPAATPTPASGRMSLKETVHSKKGHKLFVVVMNERVEKDVYDRMNRDAKRTGNGYSSYRGHGAIPGFQFLDKGAAEEFMQRWVGANEAAITETDTPAAENRESGRTQVSYHSFMADVYAALDDVQALHDAALNTPQNFEIEYMTQYKKAVTDTWMKLEGQNRTAGEAYQRALQNTAEMLGPQMDRYRNRFSEQRKAKIFNIGDEVYPVRDKDILKSGVVQHIQRDQYGKERIKVSNNGDAHWETSDFAKQVSQQEDTSAVDHKKIHRDLERTGSARHDGVDVKIVADVMAGNGYQVEVVRNGNRTRDDEILPDLDAAREHAANILYGKVPGKDQPETRSASDILKEAALQGKEGMGEIVTGLYELFGGSSLKSFPGGIDESTYAKAKPHFQAALEKFRAAGEGLREFVRFLLEQFGPGMKPYLMRFVAELKGETFDEVKPDLTNQEQSATLLNEESQTETKGDSNELSQVSTRPDGSEGSERTEGERGTGSVSQRPGDERGDNGEGVRGRDSDENKEQERQGRNRTSRNGGNDSARTGRGRSLRHAEVTGHDYRITEEDRIGKGGAKEKARNNIAAIRLLKQITAEGRPATTEEQAILTRYVGWGASELANGVFPERAWDSAARRSVERFKEDWESLGQELRDLLSDEEYQAAKASTLNAHYTSPGVIRGIWQAAQRLGFGKGRILEPGAGINLFVGLSPSELHAASRFTSVELDPISAGIAKLLYPTQDARHADFTKFIMPKGFYDLVIGNPPFADIRITSDPEYAKYKFSLHDYFFAKSMDLLRPGGIMTLVTSRYTMDKANDAARAYLAKQADIVGAIRLPQTAFKENAGTEVVTDVLFLRKRLPGEPPSGPAWSELKEIETRDGAAYVNEYFADHSEMVLGEHALSSGMYGGNQYTVETGKGGIEEAFAAAISHLPENIYSEPKIDSPAVQANVVDEVAPSNIKEGAYYLDAKGNLLQKENGVGIEVKSKTGTDIIRSFAALRDAARAVLHAQLADLSDAELLTAQRDLNKAYDDFVKKHGLLNKARPITRVDKKTGEEKTSYTYPNFNAFRDDPDASFVMALEEYDSEKQTASKTDIFSKRVIRPEVAPKVESVSDALHVVLHETGKVDMARIAEMMGLTEEQAAEGLGDLVYLDPESRLWQTDDEYLSGYVKDKLAFAQAAAELDDKFERNVKALEAVQPPDKEPSKIQISLGMPIIKPEWIQQFARDVVDMGVRVNHVVQTGQWSVEKVSGWQGAGATSDYGTARRNAADLLDAALNKSQVSVYDTLMEDGKERRVLNEDETRAANEKLQRIKDRFASWIWTNPERSMEVARRYNDEYNNFVKREYGGKHIEAMTFPGVSAVKTPFAHQRRVAWRIVQRGNTYMAHSVGAGKTIASVLAGMELKRLGIKKKPMWVVPNHMLQQFAREFLELYPAAKIIVADETNFQKENRERFLGRVASQNWDGVIITHSAFKMIPMSGQFQAEYIQEQIDEIDEIINWSDKREDRVKIKQLERQRKRLEERLAKSMNSIGQGKGVTFEETGIDQIFIDEAHEFRKLDFATNQGNIKGIDPNGSDKAFDLYMKGSYLEKLYPGRSLVLMSGTTITNTIGEIYSVQRFLQGPLLKNLGLHNFDAWASTFGDIKTALEKDPAGNYKPVTRFARFRNMTQLQQMVADVFDSVHAKDLHYLKRPSVRTGGRQFMLTKESPAQKSFKKRLEERIEAIRKRKGPPRKGDDILLSVITDGRHAALADEYAGGSSGPGSKLGKAVENIHLVWEKTKKERKTQMVFMDLGVSGAEDTRGFSAYVWMRDELVKKGIPAKEIAFMQDYKKSADKQKLFNAMNRGDVRVLIGSSASMGTGVNAQKLLAALHHMDPDTYLPSNIEQREGRIVRQGNSNEEVDLFVYATKGSFDETMWQFIESKQRFIDNFLNGNEIADEVTDVDGAADDYALAKAMSSDNPLVLEQAGVQAEVERLESLQRAHLDEQHRLARLVDSAGAKIEDLEKSVRRIEASADKRIDTSGKLFTIEVDGKNFEERKEAGAYLADKLREGVERKEETEYETIGKLAGYDLQMSTYALAGTKGTVVRSAAFMRLADGANSTPRVAVMDDEAADIDPVGLVVQLENKAKQFESDLNQAKTDLLKHEKALKDAQARIGRPFEYTEQLEDRKARLRQIEQELQQSEQSEGGEAEELSDAVRFSLSHDMEINSKFNDDVESLANGKLTVHHIFNLGKPSQILMNTGIPDLPIRMKLSTARKVTGLDGKGKHDLPAELLYNFPRHINNPVAVFDSDTQAGARTLLLQFRHNGKPVMAALHLEERLGNLEVNEIASIYEREENKFVNWILKGRLISLDKAKGQWLLERVRRTIRPQTSGSLTPNKILYHKAYEVKSGVRDDASRYSVSASMSFGLPAADIRTAFAPVYLNMPKAPPWRVVQTAAELPERALDDAARRGIPQRLLQAVYLGNEVVYVADHFRSIEEAKQIILEEVVVHHGLRSILPAGAFDKHMLQASLWYANKRTDEWKAIGRQYGLDLKSRAGRIEAAEEMLGRDARTGKDSTMLSRIIAAVKEFLRSIGFDIGYGEAEIRELLGKARRFIEGKESPTPSPQPRSGGIDYGALIRNLREQGITDEQLQAFAAYEPGAANFSITEQSQNRLREVLEAVEKIAAGSEEVTLKDLRNDLAALGGTNDVTLVWGDSKKGLRHVGEKRGAKVVADVLTAVAHGSIAKHVAGKKTVHVVLGKTEAVLSLDEYGNRKTWLLTGWKIGEPDASAGVSAHAEATQVRTVFSRSDLGADSVRHIITNMENFSKLLSDTKFALARLQDVKSQITGKGVSLNTSEREVLEADRTKALEAIGETVKDYDEPGRFVFRAFYESDQKQSPGTVPYNPERGHYAAGENLKGSWWTTSLSTAQEIAWSKSRDGRPVKIVALPVEKIPAVVYIQNTNPPGMVYDLFVGLPADVSMEDVQEMPVDSGVRYALAEPFRSVSEQFRSGTVRRNLAKLLNPLDWSRLKRWVEDVTPQNIRNGAATFLRNPVFEAEADDNKKPFVETGVKREETKLDYLLRFLGWDGPAAKAPGVMERLKKTYSQWESSDRTTEWGRITDTFQKLTAVDRTGVDLLLYRGDVVGKVFKTFEMVQSDPKTARVSETAFTVYQQVRTHIDTVVADAIEQLSRQFMFDAGLPEDVIEKHLSDYRARREERPGWLPRNHGEGDHQVNVYHIINGLKWETRGDKDSMQAFLPYFPSKEVADEIKKLCDMFGLKYRQLRNGQQLITTDKYASSRFKKEITKLREQIAEAKGNAKAELETKLADMERTRLFAEALPVEQIKRFKEKAAEILPKLSLRNEMALRERKEALQQAIKDGEPLTTINMLKDELKKYGDGRIKVKVYMRLEQTNSRAKRHEEAVRKDLKKHLPNNYREDAQYEVESHFADQLSESMYGDMKNDFAMEQAQLAAIDRAAKTREITKEEAAALRNKILQSTAEVLMARGAGRHQIRRAEYLIEGYDAENTVDAFHDYMTGAAGMLSKARYAYDQFEHFRYASPEVKRWAEKYIKDNLRNMGFADMVSGNMRALASFAYLGFKVSSMIINATQPWTLGIAELGRHTKRSAVWAIGKAQKDIIRGKLSDGERRLFASEIFRVQEQETAVHEMSGSREGATGKASRWMHTLTDKALAPFQEVELLNRKTVILAAYRTFRADGLGRDEALEKALEVNRAVNFEMSRSNLPGFAQKPLGRTVYALQSFMWNNWNWVFNRMTSGKKEDMIALLRYAAATAIIAGVAALPGGDELDKLYQMLFGESPKLALKKWTRAHAREYGSLGEMVHGFAWHGLASATGVNISNALRLQIPIVSPLLSGDSLPDAAGGVFTGLWQKGARAATAASRGDIYRTIENLSPEALAGGMRAYRMASKGATTGTGKVIFDENGKPMKYTTGEAVKRMFGFQPSRVSERGELTNIEKGLTAHWKEERGDLLAELRLSKPGEERRKVMLEIIKFNHRLNKSQAKGLIPVIKAQTIKQALSSRPDKGKAEWEREQLGG